VALFLTILEGDTPEKAKPLIATRDKEIIRLVTAELSRRLTASPVNSKEIKSDKSHSSETGDAQ
jgi:hypothetical protein